MTHGHEHAASWWPVVVPFLCPCREVFDAWFYIERTRIIVPHGDSEVTVLTSDHPRGQFLLDDGNDGAPT